MDDLQSWWEVPTIAHFCYVFRAAFNLFYFQIEELENALLDQPSSTEKPCVTVEQLAMRLLQGCNSKKTVNVENWEEILCARLQLHPLIANRHDYLLNGVKTFSTLDLKEKVELLLSLCEMRLDGDDVVEAIKDLGCDSLRIEPVGTDSENNTYWYFFGTRLYKEDLKLQEVLSKAKKRGPKPKTPVVNGRGRSMSSRRSSRTVNKTDVSNSSAWSIVCWTIEDWETLSSSLLKSTVSSNRVLSRKIQKQYIPMLQEIIAEQESLRKKRLLELLPRRSSVRIDLHKQQLEEVRLKRAAAEEEVRRKREMEETAKQASEKNRAAENRAKRAKLRELKLQYSDNSNSSSATFDAQTPKYCDYSASEANVSENMNNGGASSEAANIAMDATENTSSQSESFSEKDNSDNDESYMPKRKVPKQFSPQKNKSFFKKIKLPRPQVIKKAKSVGSNTKSRNFSQNGALQLNSPRVKASILYHSFKTYSAAKTYQHKPELNGEQNTVSIQNTTSSAPTVIMFDIVRDSETNTNTPDQ